jgi:hypothetical protein
VVGDDEAMMKFLLLQSLHTSFILQKQSEGLVLYLDPSVFQEQQEEERHQGR